MSASAIRTGQAGTTRRPTIGIVAVVIATQCVTTLLRLPDLVVRLLHGTEALGFLLLFGVTTGAGLVAVALGLVAMISGRGRWWGLAAVLIAVFGNISVLELTRSLVGAR
jgi:hypothetical protein